MDGYVYILVTVIIIMKFSFYFCWYKLRRERYLAAHQAIIIQRTQCSNVYVRNEQGNIIPASIYENQGLVERPVASHYQPVMPYHDIPPAYSDIGEQTKEMNNEPAPPSYYSNASGPNPDATPYPYPANAAAGISTNAGAISGPQQM